MERKLYYSSLSPYARTVRIILSELNLDYLSDQLDKMRPVENISAVNPNLSIPVMQDRGITLFDSGVICEYLFDTYGQRYHSISGTVPLFLQMYRPENKWSDLKILATLETLTETLVSIFLFRASIERSGANPNNVDYLTRQTTRVDSILTWLDKQASKEGFHQGYFTIQDIKLISALGMCTAVDLFDWQHFAALKLLAENFENRKSIVETTP